MTMVMVPACVTLLLGAAALAAHRILLGNQIVIRDADSVGLWMF